jgi:gamma-glutamylputrescine oxidase
MTSLPGHTYYEATAPQRAPSAALGGAVDCDTCVVGGGFAGVNTAFGLVERGVRDVVLLEAEGIGRGASGRNGGFVFGGFSLGEADLLRQLGPARARALHHGTLEAVARIRSRVTAHGIPCDLVDAGVLWANWFDDPGVLESRRRLLREHYGVEWEWIERARLRELLRTGRYGDALFEREAFHFHPLAYLRGLADVAASRGVTIHEGTPAVELRRDGGGWIVRTPSGPVRANRVVLACGGYLSGLRRKVDASVLPIATYVMVTEPLGPRLDDAIRTRAAVYDTRFAFDYYRALPDTRLLWGGRISILERPAAAVERLLRRDMLKVFPQLEGVRTEYAWSGLMSYARHEMPQVGEIEPGLWVAQAFGGHGVAPTTFAGEVVAGALAGDDQGWREFRDFGLASAHKPAGFAAAQLTYWWLQAKDAWKDWRERTPG